MKPILPTYALAFLVIVMGCVEPASAACKLGDIEIKSIRARFVNECRVTPCFYMKGAAVLTHRCAEPVGVEIKVTGFDKAGAPVAVRELWPASTTNVPPGDYTFSLDQWLDYDPDIKRFELVPIRVRRW